MKERSGGRQQHLFWLARPIPSTKLPQHLDPPYPSPTPLCAKQACGRLFASGDVRVWNLLYEAQQPAVPVDRQDPRWERLGLPVARPRFDDLGRAFRSLCAGQVVWREVKGS